MPPFAGTVSRGAVLTGLQLLLTYTCLYECDHCFLYCGPRAQGTFTVDQLELAVTQIGAPTPEVDSLYFMRRSPPLPLDAWRLVVRPAAYRVIAKLQPCMVPSSRLALSMTCSRQRPCASLPLWSLIT